jgi:DNA invertase Pin-like site-specific DNA recombinase
MASKGSTHSNCPLPPGSRVAGYFRDSGGDEQERSVDQQRRVAEEYCQRPHLVLVHVFADVARPGSTIVGRDGFDDLIHYCRQHAPTANRRTPDAPDGILLWDLKRFARNRQDNAFFKADLRRRGYTVLFLSDNIPQGGIGHIYEAMLEWKAEQDLQDISKDVKRGLSDLVSTRGPDGQYLGLCPGRPPTGFKGEPYTLGVKRDGRPRIVQRWVPDPETWDLCRQAWEMRVNGASYRQIHEATRLMGSIGCYATFFRNRIYTGTLVYSGQEYEDFVRSLVTEDAWEQVQALRKPRYEHRPRLDSSDYALSGLLYCGLCGRAMKADSVRARADAGDGYQRRRYRRYTCTGWKQNRDCSMHFLRAELVEQAVFDFLAEQVLLPEHLLQVLQDAQPDDEERRVLEQDAQLLKITLADVEQVISRLVDAIERSGHSASLAERLAEREAERSRVRVQLSEVQHRLEETKVDVPLAVLEDFCDHAREALQHGALEDVRAVLHSMVVRVEAEQGGGRLVYNFPFVVGL